MCLDLFDNYYFKFLACSVLFLVDFRLTKPSNCNKKTDFYFTFTPVLIACFYYSIWSNKSNQFPQN